MIKKILRKFFPELTELEKREREIRKNIETARQRGYHTPNPITEEQYENIIRNGPPKQPPCPVDFPADLEALNFNRLRKSNEKRKDEWQKDENGNPVWLSLSFRGNELAGEVGELCNLLKKWERVTLKIKGGIHDIESIKEELADVIICADLIAMDLGVDLSEAIKNKFNKTSEKNGLETRIQ